MPQTIAPWFANASNTVLIAQRDGQVAAVGAYNASREIILNYVAPAHRFAGVSTALLAAIERLLGPGEARLNSTLTAQNFYRQRGWVETGRVESWAGMASPEMRKMLRSI